MEKSLELNAIFKETLSEREVITDTRSAEKAYEVKKYKYTNAKLIKILEITLEEQRHLETVISGKEKYRRSAEEQKSKKKAKRRNENGLTKKQQGLKDLKISIEYLKSKGLSNRKIAKELGFSEGKIRVLLKNRCVKNVLLVLVLIMEVSRGMKRRQKTIYNSCISKVYPWEKTEWKNFIEYLKNPI